MSCFTGASFLDLVFSGVMLFYAFSPEGTGRLSRTLVQGILFLIQYHTSRRLSRTIVRGKHLFNTIHLEDSRVPLCKASIYSMLKGRKTLAYHCAEQVFIQCHKAGRLSRTLVQGSSLFSTIRLEDARLPLCRASIYSIP